MPPKLVLLRELPLDVLRRTGRVGFPALVPPYHLAMTLLAQDGHGAQLGLELLARGRRRILLADLVDLVATALYKLAVRRALVARLHGLHVLDLFGAGDIDHLRHLAELDRALLGARLAAILVAAHRAAQGRVGRLLRVTLQVLPFVQV